MAAKSYLITGGAGFLGAALVRRLLEAGHRVRVLDNQSRGSVSRLADLRKEFEFVEGDVRDSNIVATAAQGMDSICHFAAVNGTEFFYSIPDVVLDVSVRGIINVLDACRQRDIGELILASSSEVYQTPPVIPTDERAPLTIPDPMNPRYSYAAGKMISELMLIHHGRKLLERALIVRPHNVYGPDMGWEHVIPQFVLAMNRLRSQTTGRVQFPIQGDGTQTRSFVFIDDFINGLILLLERGEHLGIYNIGTTEEITIAEVARQIAAYFGREVEIVPGPAPEGVPKRRCPDIGKLAALGYRPKTAFRDGLQIAAKWYVENADQARRK
jgi:nucleoside-diphosphate-sugar epimerase